MNKIISTRLSLFKFIGTACLIHAGSTYIYNNLSGSNLTMSVTDYMNNQNIKQNSHLQIMGIVKPRSIKLTTQILGKQFILTDQRNQIKCFFEGFTKGEFKQGQMTLVTGYCPDIRKKTYVVVKEYFTNHSMETKQWQSKQNVSRNSYGIQTYR